MSFSDKLGNTIKNFLPAPFTIAVLLSLVTFLLAFFISDKTSEDSRVFEILSYWEKGLWDSKMTVFAMQMMLLLVLGHSLALTKPINKLIKGFHIPKLTNHVSPRPTKVRNIRIPQIVSPVCMSLYPLFQASNITPNQVTKEKTKIASIAVITI